MGSLLASLVLIAATGFAIAKSSTVVQNGPTPQSVWEEWVNEDVAYIISPEEKAAFERLRTDDERQHFVGQFWDRRNPTPGSAVNAFKQEHYRRLAFANEHFASNVPGWQTDRGRIYIVNGPPDEIDAYPASAGTPTGRELWRYRKHDGTFTFEVMFKDASGNGDYRLQSRIIDLQIPKRRE